MTAVSRTSKPGETATWFSATGRTVAPSSVGHLLDIDSVALRLGVSSRFVRRLVAERRIAYVKVGHLVRFESVDVTRWINDSRVDPIRAASHKR